MSLVLTFVSTKLIGFALLKVFPVVVIADMANRHATLPFSGQINLNRSFGLPTHGRNAISWFGSTPRRQLRGGFYGTISECSGVVAVVRALVAGKILVVHQVLLAVLLSVFVDQILCGVLLSVFVGQILLAVLFAVVIRQILLAILFSVGVCCGLLLAMRECSAEVMAEH